MANQITFTWSLRREANDGFVREERSDGQTCEFGPMPPHVVPAFAKARQRFVKMMMEREGNKHVEEPLSDEELKLFQ